MLTMKEISLDKRIARGRTADVYDWDDGHVLKLFHNWFELENIEYELKIATAVHASGVKAPAVTQMIHVHGRNGLIYERVAGESMLDLFQRKPWMLFAFSRILARLHAQMQEYVFDGDGIPTQRRRLQNKINHADTLSSSLKTSLLNALHSLPEGDRVCHGDFHPANVLIAGENAQVIDWMDASRGNPLADVARTSIIFLGSAATKEIPNLFLKIFIKIAHAEYLREYFRLRPNRTDEYYRWLPIVAGARLSENIPELAKWLIQQAEKIK
jgi:Ser/Thr protein kinase RdoA (MazF antagonist)